MNNFQKHSAEENKYITQLEMQAIFYWVLGGLGLFASFFLFIYGVIFGIIFFNDFMREIIGTVGSNIAEWVAGVYISIFVLVFSLAILHIIQGFKLNSRKHRGFSIFVSCFSIIAFPLGTILGIFTLISLSNPIVKELYFKEMERKFENSKFYNL